MKNLFRQLLVSLLAILVVAGRLPGWFAPSVGTAYAGPTPPPASGWQLLGDAGFSGKAVESVSTAVYDGTSYVAFYSESSINEGRRYFKPYVMMYEDNVGWTELPALSDEELPEPEEDSYNSYPISLLVSNGMPVVAYVDPDENQGHKVTVKAYINNDWESLGEGITDKRINTLDIGTDGHNFYIAAGNDSGNLAVYRYDGNQSWSELAYDNPLSNTASVSGLSLTFFQVDSGGEGIPIVAYTIGNSELIIKMYSGNEDTWKTIQSISGLDNNGNEPGRVSIAFDHVGQILYVAYLKTDKLRVDKLDNQGTAWTAVGDEFVKEDQPTMYIDLAIDGQTPYVAYSTYHEDGDLLGYKASVAKFDGTRWQDVGQRWFTAKSAKLNSLVVENGTVYLAFRDLNADDMASVMKFTPSLTPLTPPVLSPDSNPFNPYDENGLKITFPEDTSWRTAISGISYRHEDWGEGKYEGISQYTKDSPGEITIEWRYFGDRGDYEIVVHADGYNDAAVTQSIFPPAPTNLTATPGDGQVVLTWDGVEGATGYRVSRAASEEDVLDDGVATTFKVDGNTLTYTDKDLSNGNQWYYAVQSYFGGEDKIYSDYLGPASATPTAPSEPAKVFTLEPLSVSSNSAVIGMDYDSSIKTKHNNVGILLSKQESDLTNGFCTECIMSLTARMGYKDSNTDKGKQTYYRTPTLEPITKYYYRTYVKTNDDQLLYGDTLSFTTKHAPTISDIADQTAVIKEPIVIPLQIDDPDYVPGYMPVYCTSGNPESTQLEYFISNNDHSVIDDSSIVFTTDGEQPTVTITPRAGAEAGIAKLIISYVRIGGCNPGEADSTEGFSLTWDYPDDPSGITIPTVVTDDEPNVDSDRAQFDFTLTDNGGSEITNRGVLLSTDENDPLTLDEDSWVVDQTDAINHDIFVATDLTPGTTYYYRSFAVNEAGVGYGEILSFVTEVVPSISAIPDQVVAMNETIGPLSFTISDPKFENDEGYDYSNILVGFWVESLDGDGVVADDGVVISQEGATREITITPIRDQVGSAIIHLEFENEDEDDAKTSFKVTVNPPNTPEEPPVTPPITPSTPSEPEEPPVTPPTTPSTPSEPEEPPVTPPTLPPTPSAPATSQVTIIVSDPSHGGAKVNQPITSRIGSNLSLTGQLQTADGKSLNLANVQIDGKGKMLLPNVPAGEYKVLLYVVAPTGEQLAGRVAKLTVDSSGNAEMEAELIDPYGHITNRYTGKPIGGVKVTLHWADTELNRKNGRKPGDLVVLPILPDFAPNQNKDPQHSDNTGAYAWMVFPDADYYIVGEKDGYETFDSREDDRDEKQGDDSYIRNGNIHVGVSIVKYDFKMEPIAMGSGEHQPYMSGYPDGSFRPDIGITRAEMATILGRLFVSDVERSAAQTFKDVKSTNWAAEAIATAATQEWMIGYPSGDFKPNQQITRAEFAQIMMAVKHWDAGAAQTTSFSDIAGHWAKPAIEAATQQGVFASIVDGANFQPDQIVTRTEIVRVLNALLHRNTLHITRDAKWTDVPMTHKDYNDIVEASIPHFYMKLDDDHEIWAE